MTRRGIPWITGPDPLHHEMYVAYGYKRQSCLRRGEAWSLTWEQYRDLWLPLWDQRGTEKHSLCMARCDVIGEWEIRNVELITRKEHGSKVRKYYS